MIFWLKKDPNQNDTQTRLVFIILYKNTKKVALHHCNKIKIKEIKPNKSQVY